MGPRSGERGNPITRARVKNPIPRFNGAAFGGTRKSRAGTLYRHWQSCFNGAAFGGTRKFLSSSAVISAPVASMGPRSGERGNIVATEIEVSPPLLQWGRVRGNAEIAAIATDRQQRDNGSRCAGRWIIANDP